MRDRRGSLLIGVAPTAVDWERDASDGGAPQLVEMRRGLATGRQCPSHRWSTSTRL